MNFHEICRSPTNQSEVINHELFLWIFENIPHKKLWKIWQLMTNLCSPTQWIMQLAANSEIRRFNDNNKRTRSTSSITATTLILSLCYPLQYNLNLPLAIYRLILCSPNHQKVFRSPKFINLLHLFPSAKVWRKYGLRKISCFINFVIYIMQHFLHLRNSANLCCIFANKLIYK